MLYNNWRLPQLTPGHVLAIMDTGAYFVPFSTTFSFPKPAIVMQDGDGPVSPPTTFADVARGGPFDDSQVAPSARSGGSDEAARFSRA